MATAIHGSARTTPRLRDDLQTSKESTRSLAANFAKYLKALHWKTPFQTICEAWAKDAAAFTINRHHLIPRPYS